MVVFHLQKWWFNLQKWWFFTCNNGGFINKKLAEKPTEDFSTKKKGFDQVNLMCSLHQWGEISIQIDPDVNGYNPPPITKYFRIESIISTVVSFEGCFRFGGRD